MLEQGHASTIARPHQRPTPAPTRSITTCLIQDETAIFINRKLKSSSIGPATAETPAQLHSIRLASLSPTVLHSLDTIYLCNTKQHFAGVPALIGIDCKSTTIIRHPCHQLSSIPIQSSRRPATAASGLEQVLERQSPHDRQLDLQRPPCLVQTWNDSLLFCLQAGHHLPPGFLEDTAMDCGHLYHLQWSQGSVCTASPLMVPWRSPILRAIHSSPVAIGQDAVLCSHVPQPQLPCDCILASPIAGPILVPSTDRTASQPW